MYSIRYFINFAINCNGRMHYNMIINTLCRLIILNDVIDALLLVHKRHDAKDLLYRYYTVVIFVSSGGGAEEIACCARFLIRDAIYHYF